MAGGPSYSTLRDIQTLFETGTVAGMSDGQLLERFQSLRDASAFEALVLRHGPMVLRVCRNALPDLNDAHDAFQATFLVLVRRCRSIRKQESVGSWLYGVANRVAARARVEAARRRSVERRGGLRLVATVDSPGDGDPDRAEFGPVIQEEVRRLPEKYRAAILLCYWQGLTHEQAAVQLGIPLGTVRSRVARARDMLRRRLIRRGLTPVGCEAAPALDALLCLSPLAIPNELLHSTIKAGALVATGSGVTNVTSASVAALVQSVLRSLIMTKLKTIAICLLFIGTGVVGAILAAPQSDSKREARVGRGAVRPDASKAQPPLHALGSYVVEPPDLLIVEVLEALPGRPISGERLVRPDGTISLSFYGDISVAGLTIPEVKEKIVLHLRKFLNDETLGLIGPDCETDRPQIDPKISTTKLINPRDTDRVYVDVTAYNSKNYYVQGAVAVPGRLPVTGGDTILDVINYAEGLLPEADHVHVVLYRQEKGGSLKGLPIDIDQIMMGDDLSTNYQIEPGDRLVIPQLAKTQGAASKSTSRRPLSEPSKHEGGSSYFNRQPDEAAAPQHDRARQPAVGNVNRDPLVNVERRLSEVERKLDMILEALKSRAQ
jgi:polysaccharide biosynthesis/export protein